MTIEINTEMMLFRFSNYKKHSFIDAHQAVLQKEGHVWMLKFGRKTDNQKLQSIIRSGGWLVLRAPKAEGGKTYLAKFTDVQEESPIDMSFPAYYKELFESPNDYLLFKELSRQWFRLVSLKPISKSEAASLVISKSGKRVEDVIKVTRTAVMFVKNEIPIEVYEGG